MLIVDQFHEIADPTFYSVVGAGKVVFLPFDGNSIAPYQIWASVVLEKSVY